MPACQHAGKQATEMTMAMTSGHEDHAVDVVSLTVRVPRELRRQLRLHAVESGISVQQCTVEAVRTWLDKQHEQKSRATP